MTSPSESASGGSPTAAHTPHPPAQRQEGGEAPAAQNQSPAPDALVQTHSAAEQLARGEPSLAPNPALAETQAPQPAQPQPAQPQPDPSQPQPTNGHAPQPTKGHAPQAAPASPPQGLPVQQPQATPAQGVPIHGIDEAPPARAQVAPAPASPPQGTPTQQPIPAQPPQHTPQGTARIHPGAANQAMSATPQPPSMRPAPSTPPDGNWTSAHDTDSVPRPGSEVVGHLPPAGYPLPAPAPGAPMRSMDASSSGVHPGLVDQPPVPRRYFEDVTQLVVSTLDALEGGPVIGWAHDRVDPDTMGANGLLMYLLRERYQLPYACYYSKRMSFLMNRSLATNFLPTGVLRRCEATENLSEIAHKAELIVVLDATSPEIMTDFSHLLRRSEEMREKQILFIDHHRRGKSDIEALPNANGVRNEGGQATSAIMLHVLLNLGLELGQDDETFRLAVVAKAGIETDLIGVDPSGYAESTRVALDYLDAAIGERGQAILNKLSAIKHPPGWYRKLGQALTEVGNYDSNIAICGLGVINDTGIVPFVANRLMEMGPYKTTIVFGIVYDVVDGQIVSIDLDASGRSSADTEIVLADLFHEIFYTTDSDNRRTPKGGGRANKLLGDFSGAGASVPLDYWRHINCRSADQKKSILKRLAWPAEFLRLRHLLTQRISSLKPEEVRSVDPIDVLEGL